MATTYPVRVRNLDQKVCQRDLYDHFSKYGTIDSCRVIPGLSDTFGYVNFYSEQDAEKAAKEMNNRKIYSLPITTIGPRALARSRKESLQAADRRPPMELTDCYLFMSNRPCRDEKCPFRHCERARYSPAVCANWQEKKCLDAYCPDKHPSTSYQRPHRQFQRKDDVQRVEQLPYGFCNHRVSSEETITTQHQPILLDGSEGRRLWSEVRHLLISHQEHAMTFIELAENIRILSDDAHSPSVEELYQCLKEKPDTFIIAHIPKSIPRKTVQLNRTDCYRKLQSDIIHIFICNPTEELSLPVRRILDFYSECYGHSLNLSIYDCNTVPNLMRKPAVVEIMEMNQDSGLCSLTKKGMIAVISSLFAELIYSRGGSISLNDLPGLYQDYFGVQLNLCGTPSLSDLMKEPIFCKMFQIMNNAVHLSDQTKFAEQIRHLLTVNSGKILLSQLGEMYFKEFGIRFTTESLHSKILSLASHVARIAGNKWLIWETPNFKIPPRNVNSSKLHKDIMTEMCKRTMERPETTTHSMLPYLDGKVPNMEPKLQQTLEGKVKYSIPRNEQRDTSNNAKVNQKELSRNVVHSDRPQIDFQSGWDLSQVEKEADELEENDEGTYNAEEGSNCLEKNCTGHASVTTSTSVQLSHKSSYQVTGDQFESAPEIWGEVTSGHDKGGSTSPDIERCPSQVLLEGDKFITGNNDLKRNVKRMDNSLAISDHQLSVEFNYHLTPAAKEDKVEVGIKSDSKSFEKSGQPMPLISKTAPCIGTNKRKEPSPDFINGQPRKRNNLAIRFPNSDVDYRKAECSAPEVSHLPQPEDDVALLEESSPTKVEASRLQGQCRAP